jgi:hypothetical protein
MGDWILIVLGKKSDNNIGIEANHSPLAPRAIALSMSASETARFGAGI